MRTPLLVGLSLATLLVAGCSSSPSADADKVTAAEPIPASTDSCPTATPAADSAAQWTFAGKTGKIAVVAPTTKTAPKVTVTGPFAVDQTTVHTLATGSGPKIADTATVSVCYQGVNGRDGKVFDSAFERGTPTSFPLNGVVPGFTKAIAGQNVGSTVAVAVASADGYPQGQPDAGIQAGDTLIFTISILSAS
jgi:FKBP-type peptidyl-prolyl cis-trans isomerase